jgi:serine/threonine-protein kinase
MTGRDSRFPPSRSSSGRDPTQSLSLSPDEEDSHPSLAMGTSGDEATRAESPLGRGKPIRPSTRPPPVPYSPDDPAHQLGQVLGTYKLVELLGKGGMGYVYRAEHVKLGREVALKLLRADYARRRDAVLRFFQEAKTVNRVRHRNIVDVTDFVELDDGTTFIIMELLSGTSLGKWARGGIDLPRALAVLVQICDGLGAAHAVGVIHRDLKPDNVIVVPTSDGGELVKLLDFGVAKLVNREDEDLGFQTAAGSVIGTPAYMSPEQAGGMAIDHRSDIYSLGAIMYELFCGQPMFRGRSFGEYVRKHLTEMPMPPHQTQGGATIDPRLEALILRSLAKDPNERFGHILELRDGLLHMLGGIGGMDTSPPTPRTSVLSASQLLPSQSHALPLPPPAMSTTVPSVHSAPSLMYSHYTPQPTQQPAEAATPWWVWLVGGACAVGLGVAGAVWYAGRDSGLPPPVAQPAPQPAAATQPTAAPIEPTVKPQIIEVRFDSLPNAGVFAEGHSAELCRTPCSFDVNVADGGPQDHRKFLVRAGGYRDQLIDVDLAAAQHDYSVTLAQLSPTPAPATPSEPAPSKTHGPHGKPPHGKPAETKPVEPASPPPPPPTEPTKPGKIDPSDTLDPFHHS